ncbi:MAG TPA: beta-ketoacyl synthase N-terminal-like domain-containing protein, partial [Candidatus Methylomirabilis sp.]|nr:beta-ketoacyl synthase N-terminal-like domain-containing protein [Candidatus Methylomirabilis sp.]
MRRVVITGLGVIAATGKDVPTFFKHLVNAQSGTRRISLFDPAALSVQIAAEVPEYRSADYFPPKRLDFIDRFTEFALIAAKQAMDSSGLQVREAERERFGVVIGSGMGGAVTFDKCYYSLFAQQATRLHPFTIPKIMHNAATSQICMEYGAQGPSLAVSTACSSAGHAMGEAFHLIKFGLADVMMAGGSDTPITYGMIRSWES